MKKLIAIALAVALISSGLVVSVASADDGGSNALGGVSVATTHEYTDTGWAKTVSETNDCVDGWGDDDWELTVSAFGFLTVTVEDCCLVGDYYEIYVDGVKVGTTPDPGYVTAPGDTPIPADLSVGSATVWIGPGVHTIEIRDALDFSIYDVAPYNMCPAGYSVTGVWEPVVEFTKEITDTVEGGDMDGRLEPGEDWYWTFDVSMKNLADETLTVTKLHDRLGGDLWWHIISWNMPLIGEIEYYWKGKTNKAFINFYDGFTLAPDQEEWLFSVNVSPDTNTGKGTANNPDKNGNKNPKVGHQEYTSTGEHCLNSGAWFEGYIGDEYIEASTNPVCVEVLEAD